MKLVDPLLYKVQSILISFLFYFIFYSFLSFNVQLLFYLALLGLLCVSVLSSSSFGFLHMEKPRLLLQASL